MKEKLKFPLRGKYVAMLAPSFAVDFEYPSIISQLNQLGFDKIVEVTFGAKIVNSKYHFILKNSKELKIATVCPGIVSFVENNFPKYKKNLIKIDSPMNAMAKICKKIYPNHKIVFFSPCNFKKVEAKKIGIVDYVLDFKELKNLFSTKKIKLQKGKFQFDKFYNDYTKIYPLAGGLSKTAHLKNILSKREFVSLDGVNKVKKFLENPPKKIKFLDANFCIGGCIGGPCINSSLPIFLRKAKIKKYLKKAKKENIPEIKKGFISKAKGIDFQVSFN